ncbi:hypothetical protein [Amycolatopsis anabasis]|uniref:hypothetical protein n=1 Tax=Amycolatopsis anabasis TaxID=1840409 RepID=UPI00131E323C|nr:hypothetical protein [Amycolatopsis anabasis]
MSMVPLAAPGGENGAADDGRGDVRGIADLAQRIVAAAYLRHPGMHRCLVLGLGVLLASCLVATGTRLSMLPLLPVPVFAVAGFALHRMRATAEHRRALLVWSALFAVATLVGFWLMSVVARWLD